MHQVFHQCICLMKLLLNYRYAQVLTGLTCILDIYPPFYHQLSLTKQTSDISHGTQVLLPSPSPNQNQASFETSPCQYQSQPRLHFVVGNLNLTRHWIHWHPGRICKSKVTNEKSTAGNPPQAQTSQHGFPLFPGLRQRPPTRRRVSGIWALLFQQLRLGLSNLRSFVEGNCERCGWKKHVWKKRKNGRRS